MDELIDDVESGLTPELRSLYAPHLAGERQLIANLRSRAAPPDGVARAVERELTRARVRPRTPVGRDARVILLMRALLSDRAMDRVWTRSLGLPRAVPADDADVSRRRAPGRSSAPTGDAGRPRAARP
ncbi:hypothetical protein [Actinotalea solisilvae]|uniref:hypothetical protein n=1 Tax=Actinotalea solisilvae TaxID=2072922 RepID=UPI0018F1F51C|nr:hypothetical protein [Actinotalea solisilvae]